LPAVVFISFAFGLHLGYMLSVS